MSGVYTRCARPASSVGIRTERIGSKTTRGIVPLVDVSIDTQDVSIDTCLTSGTPPLYHVSIDTQVVSIDTWHGYCVDRYPSVSIDTMYNQVYRSTHVCVVRYLEGAARLGMYASGSVFHALLQRMLARSGWSEFDDFMNHFDKVLWLAIRVLKD